MAGAGVAFGVNSLSFLAEVAALLALDTTKLHRAIRDHGATVVGGALDALRFVVRAPRAGVAFFAVLVLVDALVQLQRAAAARRPADAPRERPDVRADRGGLRGGSAPRCDARTRRGGTRACASCCWARSATGSSSSCSRRWTRWCRSAWCCFLIGFCYTQWGTTALATIQLEAPERLRGRAASLYFFAFLGGAPLGGLFAGWLVEVGGTELAFYVAGLVAVLTALVSAATLRTTSPAAADLVVADQPVSDEPDAAFELQREHAA